MPARRTSIARVRGARCPALGRSIYLALNAAPRCYVEYPISRCARPATAGPIKAPKSARAAAGQNQAFKANLGTMVRNVEMIMAGKLVNEGRILRCVLHNGSVGSARRGASDERGALLRRARTRAPTLPAAARSMPSLKKLADEQLDMVRRAKEDGGSRVKAALERKNVKGLRGTLDLEEMAQLVRRHE